MSRSESRTLSKEPPPCIPTTTSPTTPYDAFSRYDEPRSLDRLTHLVLVDGRLVDTWSEPVTGTRWQHHADRFDRERRGREPVPPPPPPYERALAWLDGVCGSREAVFALTGDALTDEGCGLPAGSAGPTRARMQDTVELLDTVATQLFDAEMSCALRRALVRTWAEEPEAILRDRVSSPPRRCWRPRSSSPQRRTPSSTSFSTTVDVWIVPFDEEQAREARLAHARYGKGSGSPARLNLGDCVAYALAKVTGEPLLFKGDDFTHTDVTPALRRD